MKTDNLIDHLQRAVHYRESLSLDTNAMRLVNSRGNGIEGLIIDRFNKHFVVYILDTRWHPHQKTIRDALCEHFEVEYLVFKDRTISDTRSASRIAVDWCEDPNHKGKTVCVFKWI